MTLNAKHIGVGSVTGVAALFGMFWAGATKGVELLDHHIDARIHSQTTDMRREIKDNTMQLYVIAPKFDQQEKDLINTFRNMEAQRIKQEGQ